MRKEFNSVFGKLGEDDACKFLKEKKYKILERNYKNKMGEIDIIARDGKTLVFVEVKYRSTLQYGRPSEAVTPHKQHKIRNVATYYILRNKLTQEDVRFDVIEIIDKEINHIENAF